MQHRYEGQMDGLLPGSYTTQSFFPAGQGQDPYGGAPPSDPPRPSDQAYLVMPSPQSRPGTASSRGGQKAGLMTQKQYEAHLKERIEYVRAENAEVFGPLVSMPASSSEGDGARVGAGPDTRPKFENRGPAGAYLLADNVQIYNNNIKQYTNSEKSAMQNYQEAEHERDRRLRLREQERQRRNMNQGDEGLSYGANQSLPPKMIKPQSQLYNHLQDYGGNQGMMQLPLPNYSPPQSYNQPALGGYQPINMNQLAQAQMQMMQQANRMPEQREPDSLVRRSSKSRLSLVQAKELDSTLNQEVKKDAGMAGGFLYIGGAAPNDHQRELEKRQKQLEYQAFLDKQRAEKEMKASPNRVKERLNSARKLSSQYESQKSYAQVEQPEAPQESPNKGRRHLVRSSSSYGPKKEQAHQQNTNILGQPLPPQQQQPAYQRLATVQNDHKIPLHSRRSGSAARAADYMADPAQALIAGGLQQIGDNEQKQQEEKMRKQREYREYLDMQKNYNRTSIGGGPAAPRPPIPGGAYAPTGNYPSAGRPPSGQQHGRPPTESSFMAYSKSNMDPQYLQDHRKQLSDQVFDELMKKHHGGQGQLPEIPQAQQPQPPRREPLRRHGSMSSRQMVETAGPPDGQHPFLRQLAEESAAKQREAEKKKEYALELQNQIAQKKLQNSKPQLPPRAHSQRQSHQEAPVEAPPYPFHGMPDAYRQEYASMQQNFSAMPPAPEPPLQYHALEQHRPPLQPPLPYQQQQLPYQYDPTGAPPALPRPPVASYGPPYQPAQPTTTSFSDREQMENDPLYQQILQQKREEIRRQMELEYAQEQAAAHGRNQSGLPPMAAYHHLEQMNYSKGMQAMPYQYFASAPVSVPAQEERGPAQPSDAEMYRQRREEYKRELDAYRKEKELMDGVKVKKEVDVYNAFYRPVPGSSVQHALPYPNSEAQGEGPNSRVAVRNRTDITSEKAPASEAEQQKRVAYQEELRLQMEEQRKKKEAEKAKLKLEDERLERELQHQREALEEQGKRELVKEGKLDPNQLAKKEPKKVNRQQFETSDQILDREKKEKEHEEATGLDEDAKAAVQQQMKLRLEEELRQLESQYELPSAPAEPPVPAYRPFKLPGSAPDPTPQPQYGYNPSMPPEPIPQQYHHLKPEATPSAQHSQLQDQSFLHQKLLDDQQKMITMYQQALQQILDFRQDYFTQAQEMQLNLARERERMMDKAMNPAQPPQLEIGQQYTEIQQLQAVYAQLYVLMQRVGYSRSGNLEVTSIINPAVQTNLNDLIKAQREKVVRMSQDQSFRLRQERAGVEDKYQHRVLINQNDEPGAYDSSRNASFDQSLASNSKLIRVPNYFANKLQEKAKNFEQQRLLNQSPGGAQPQFFQNNTSSDYIMPNKSPTNRHDQSGLYSTWNQHGAPPAQVPHADASMNERAQETMSPQKAQMMHASLAGSSHLQFMNEPGAANRPGAIGETPNQGRTFSPIPHRNLPPGAQDKETVLSPTSRQMLGNLMGLHQQSRPQTNIVLQQETILEQPEKEQNLDNTNDYSHDEQMHVARRAANPQQREDEAIRIQYNQFAENDRLGNIKYQQSEQVKNARQDLRRQATIETEQDFNNRDESMTKYSQSVYGRKSKVTEAGSKESRTDQIQQNLQFIENQVNLGYKNPHGVSSNVLSNSRSPFSNGRNSGQVLSPTSAAQGQMVNIGKLVSQQSGYHPQRAVIPSQTEKSFFKPPTNNLNTSQMANTGMQGARPTATGSSFYNATMAKTKQQEQNQQEALHEQLMKIFNTGDDEVKEAPSGRPSHGRTGDGAAVDGDAGKKYLDDTEYLLNTSNINIAQSVHMSMDMKESQLQNNIGKAPGAANAAQGVGAGLGAQKAFLGARVATASSQGQSHLNATSNVDHNWLMQNNVINEQQEYENSKSREDTDTQGINSSVGKSLKVASGKRLSSHRSNAKLSQANEADDYVESQYGQTAKQSEGLWDHREPDQNEMTVKESQIEESGAFQFDGDGTASSHQQFQVIDVAGNQESTVQSNQYQLPHDDVASLPSTSRQKWQVKNSQPSSINKPYTFDPKEEDSVQESHVDGKAADGLVHHQSVPLSKQDDQGRPSEPRSQSDYNIAMEQSSARAGPYQGLEDQDGSTGGGSPSRTDVITVNKYNLQLGSAVTSDAPAYHPAAMKSRISALNLGPGLFSEGEPTSAAIIKQDPELNELQKCSPNIALNQFNTLSDPEEREQHDKLIDQMYEIRNSQQFQFQTQAAAPAQRMPPSQLLAQQKLQHNLDMLSQPSGPSQQVSIGGAALGVQHQQSLNPMEQSSDIYPPKYFPAYNANLQGAKVMENKRDAKHETLAKPRERDPILDSTPDVTPQMMYTYGREDLSDVVNEQLELNLTKSSSRGEAKQVLDTSKLEQMTPSQRNVGDGKQTSESYRVQVEENFADSLQKKYDKIKDIFKIETGEDKVPPQMEIEAVPASPKEPAPQVDALEAEGRPSTGKALAAPEELVRKSLPKSAMTPYQKNMEKPATIEESTNSRPYTNAAAATKNKELEDLARLIQAATGSVNNIVENSYQFRQTRQADRAARLKAQARSRPSLGQGSTQSPPRQEPFARAEPITQSQVSLTQTNMGQIQNKIAEDSQNDHQILTNIDQIIQNLEKQQHDTQKLQSKFSSNKAFVTASFPQQYESEGRTGHTTGADGRTDPQAETPTLPVLNEATSSLEGNDARRERIPEMLDEAVATNQHNLERSGGRATSASISQTQATVQQMEKSDINRANAAENKDFRETIMLDENYEKNKFRLQQQVARPVSNHSAISTSTNRYGGLASGSTTAAKNYNRRQEYEQFEDDEDEEGQGTGRAAVGSFAAYAYQR